MNRAATIAKGAAALCLLTILTAGIPWALTHFVGWPLPHRIPTWTQLTRALSQQGIPDDTLIKALACVVWIAWAVLVASLAVELQAVIHGATARHLTLAGPLQPAVGQLLAAIAIAALSLSPRPNPAPARPLATSIPALRPSVPAVTLTAADTRPIRVSSVEQAASTITSEPTARLYVVQRNDTLWGIAERQLGDPLRWRDIYNLNHGRPQPDGAVLTNPHWINQGWTLLLPAVTASASTPSTAAEALPTIPKPAVQPSAPDFTTTAPTNTPESAPNNSPKPTTDPIQPARGADEAPSERVGPGHSPDAVTLPSGSVVAASFAAGVLATITLGRLRRRHGYQPGPPEPGRSLASPPLGPTLRRLSAALTPLDSDPDSPTGPPNPPDDQDRRVIPELIEIGHRDGDTITAQLTDLSGVALCGGDGDEVARAWITALLTRAGPLAAEVVATAETIARLFGSSPEASGIRTAPDPIQLIRMLDSEVVARSRLLDSREAVDAVSYRRANPAEPLPGLLYLFDPPSSQDTERLKHTIALGPKLGITVIFLRATTVAATRIQLDDRTVTGAGASGLSTRLEGARLFGLTAAEATDILRALTDAEFRPTSDENPEWTETIERLEHPAPPSEPWPIDSTGSNHPDVERPIRVEVLRPLTISVMGNPINRGLRSVAKELLVYYLLRPEGATVEQAVDHLWPDTDPKLVHRQFWTAASNLRSRLREWGDLESKILEQVGEVYRLDPDTVSSDLWDFQRSLDDAARATDDSEIAAALSRAVDAYGGDLAQTSGWLWLEPVREDLHRRAVNAHLRLAELEDAAGNFAAAETALEKVVELDHYAEEPYRRLMALHAAQGHREAVKATWRQLQRRLVEIDLDPDPASASVYRRLTSDESVA